ncbi:hypothetical protein GCM10023189_46670 [Nibrella saemangeumensis]|uniref:Uncharacterized protein n=1 Tax=Nibrella saemangeumensis TaxID=1084526 RepID=A0ABP8NDW8_9BACT
MKAGTFGIRVWRFASILGLVFSLINSYISFPGEVGVLFDEAGDPVQFIGRETIFYIVVAVFLVNYILLNTMARLFPRIPTEQVPVPNRAVWATHRDQLNEIVINWFYALMAAINTVVALGVLVLSMLNRDQGLVDVWSFNWLLPLCAIIFGSVIVSLPIRLMMKPSPVDND